MTAEKIDKIHSLMSLFNIGNYVVGYLHPSEQWMIDHKYAKYTLSTGRLEITYKGKVATKKILKLFEKELA